MATKKKIPRASKHRLMIFGTLSIIVMGYFFVTLINYTIEINQLKAQERNLKTELSTLKVEADDLSTVIQQLKDPDYMARFARENYSYSADGEYIIQFEKKEKTEEVVKKADNKYKYYIYGSALFMVGIFLYIVKKK